MEKKQFWVLYSEEYPCGKIFADRDEALDESRERRAGGEEAYIRVKHMTQKEFDSLPELD